VGNDDEKKAEGEKMNISMYPICPKCKEGTLLPFYNDKGVNTYMCTVCEVVFDGPGAGETYYYDTD